MSKWKATKARRALAALKRIGWTEIRRVGSHRTLSRPGWLDYVFSYHDSVELGPIAMALLAKKTGLQLGDL